MTEEEFDQLYAVKDEVEKAITALVSDMTKDMSPEQDDLIRTLLTEDYRFWR